MQFFRQTSQKCPEQTKVSNIICIIIVIVTIHSFISRMKLENSSFKSHLLWVHLYQTNIEISFHFLSYFWVWVDCRPKSQQIFIRTSSNSINKKDRMWWICWEPVKCGRNLPIICLMKKMLKNIWKMFSPWRAIMLFTFFLGTTWTALQTKFHTSDPPSRFLQITSQIFDKIYETKNSLS